MTTCVVAVSMLSARREERDVHDSCEHVRRDRGKRAKRRDNRL
jgi:hypothetical protein